MSAPRAIRLVLKLAGTKLAYEMSLGFGPGWTRTVTSSKLDQSLVLDLGNSYHCFIPEIRNMTGYCTEAR